MGILMLRPENMEADTSCADALVCKSFLTSICLLRALVTDFHVEQIEINSKAQSVPVRKETIERSMRSFLSERYKVQSPFFSRSAIDSIPKLLALC